MTQVAADGTHHLLAQKPLYKKRFIRVLPFHAPGLAPVLDQPGAYHINFKAEPIYPQRYKRTFGFYEGLAAVEDDDGWFHIETNGTAISRQRYQWCGNFQQGFCVVKLQNGKYQHINPNAQPIYDEFYVYVGDFREGYAVVCNEQGKHNHINMYGQLLHEEWFINLGVFHKGFACAQDAQGWYHINKQGQAIYYQRFASVEPFYNGIARVEANDGAIYTINEAGQVISQIRAAMTNCLHTLSSDLVGFWRTQTIATAVKTRCLDDLPNTVEFVANKTDLNSEALHTLFRALWELDIVLPSKDGNWQLTEKGKLLSPADTAPMAQASLMWADQHYSHWQKAYQILTEGCINTDYFIELSRDHKKLNSYQLALSAYAENDYKKFLTEIDWTQHVRVIDAGGGTGTLLHTLLNRHGHLTGILLDLPEVINLVEPKNKHARCQYQPQNFFKPWPISVDAIIFARVLHDWCDEKAIALLQRAEQSLTYTGKIYVLDMLVNLDSPNGSLLNLNMFLMTGGKERDMQEWLALFSQTNLQCVAVKKISDIVSIFVLEK